MVFPRRCGETGKHDGLKIHCPQGLVGSTPTGGTKYRAKNRLKSAGFKPESSLETK